MTKGGVINTTGQRVLGRKASSLEWLVSNGARVPRTWIVDTPEQVEQLPLESHRKYAVRSSARDEDTPESAAAGIYLTELDVEPHEVVGSVQRVLASNGHSDPMTVIVQEMVDPIISGVAFSRNPVTGLSDIVIEAIDGRGDALLQDGVDPLRWTYRSDGFVESPDSTTERDDVVLQVVAETERLASKYGPADLEWVWNGEEVHIVQIRPITTVGDIPIFSRRIAKDVMPGLIKPLVWSINIPIVNSAWVRLLTQAIGPNSLDPYALARSFAYRSYFDMRTIGDTFELIGMPRDSLENLLGLPGARGRMRPGPATFLKLPRMTWLAWRMYRGRHWIEPQRNQLAEKFGALDNNDLERLSNGQLQAQIGRLTTLTSEAAYLNIVAPLLANAHVGRFKRALAGAGLDFEDIDAFPTSKWDPGAAIRQLAQALERLEARARARVADGDLSAMDAAATEALDGLIRKFGYLSENNNDLSIPRWRDSPDVPLKLALAAAGTRHRSREHDWSQVLASTDGPEKRKLARRRRSAAEHQSLREATGATFAYGYGLLRPRYVEVGRRLAENGSLSEGDDVFYIDSDRVLAALETPRPLQDEVSKVKSEMADVADLIMPEMIIGDDWIPEAPLITDRLTGVGASRGRYRGMARFIEHLSEADTLEEGEILVVEHSDVAWTPLFARAGAVVTAAGGMLAHSSITAREMGIPCVASVTNARLLDGSQVLVDGFTGEVLVEQART